METYKYATADYHPFIQSINQAVRTVCARPCGPVRAHVPQFASMRCASTRAHASFSTTV